jgi:tryptophan synthase beta chain
MYTLGHSFIPAPIHAGGLRYHGMAPIVSQLLMDNLIRAEAIPQLETFQAGITFARTEGFISAPETDHAIAVVIREAIKAKEEGKEKVILFNWSGHGLVDMAAYEDYLAGKLSDYALPEEEIHRALEDIAPLPKPQQYKPGTVS